MKGNAMWNQIKTVILLATLSGFLMLLGGILGGKIGITYALIIALIMNGITYFFADKIVLGIYRAQPLDKTTYGWIYALVQELCTTMQLPMPSLWIINHPMANAFATGRNPQHAAIALSTGIITLLEPNELRGVLAHELSHIKNRDILIATIAATLATAIGYIANMMQHMVWWSAMKGDNRRQSVNPLGLLIAAILMPLAALLVQLAISRSREYLADETGAHSSHDPLALASALEKLQQHIGIAHLDNNDTARASTAPLFIVYPFFGGGIMNLFSTHPPMQKRISRLKLMYEKMLRW
jgi:heat shock protein HtpX